MCPSPAVDVTYDVARLSVGATVRVTRVTRRPGGKAVNVARVLHAIGEPVHVLAPVGGTTGAEFAAGLAALGVPTTLVPSSCPTRSTVTVVADDGTTTVLSEPAAVDCWDALREAVTELVAHADVVVASGRLPEGAPDDAFATVVEIARAAGRPVVVDTSGPALLAALAAGPTVVKPNADELAEIAGVADGSAPVAAAGRLAASSGATVVASLGADGAVACTAGPAGERAWHGRPAAPLAGNPTGAGDAAVAGIARALRHDPHAASPPVELLRDAVALGAAAVLSPVAGDVDAAHHADQLAGVTVHELADVR
ncbi:1-phosphofructokinase family hexose kinase [Jatrophihabitans endophyticus]|uniref:1-phosphofructokinase family hexose kinase n=1 Tax=Jatrophihabitans endophyticus TaxID=1206085 RepID=UPI001F25FBBE|nr:hexose kinase [Jatrophihabitans endophyticus]